MNQWLNHCKIFFAIDLHIFPTGAGGLSFHDFLTFPLSPKSASRPISSSLCIWLLRNYCPNCLKIFTVHFSGLLAGPSIFITELFDLYIYPSYLSPNITTQACTGDLSPITVPICMLSSLTCSTGLGVGSEREIDRNINQCVVASYVGPMMHFWDNYDIWQHWLMLRQAKRKDVAVIYRSRDHSGWRWTGSWRTQPQRMCCAPARRVDESVNLREGDERGRVKLRQISCSIQNWGLAVKQRLFIYSMTEVTVKKVL